MKKTLSILLAIIMIFSMFVCGGVTSSASGTSGYCGEELQWDYSDYDKTLSIYGEGAMDDFTIGNRPWEAFVDEIEHILINDATHIGAYAFAGMPKLGGVTYMLGTLLTIGEGAFQSCEKLDLWFAQESVVAIGPSAFEGCKNLNILRISKNTIYIGDNAFEGCPLGYIIYTGTPEQANLIYFEDESEIPKNVIYADTNYDIAVQVGEYQVLTVVGIEPFTFRTKSANIAPIIETEYGTVTEDGVQYYYGAAAVYGETEGITTITAVNNTGETIGAFSALVGRCANSHTQGDQYTLKPASCHEQGIQIYECENCSHKWTSLISNEPHSFVYETVTEATCESVGLEKGVCSLCDKEFEREIPIADHKWTDWVVTVVPTEETEGEREHQCTWCEKVEKEIIPALSTVIGDANGDGKVTAMDARWVLQYAAEMRELDEHHFKLADVNNDGKVSAIDARKILQMAAA